MKISIIMMFLASLSMHLHTHPEPWSLSKCRTNF